MKSRWNTRLMKIKKKSRLLNKKDKKTYARKIVKQRVRIRKFDFRIRRDDKSLNSDYMIARKKDVIFEKHVLFELQKNHNVCSFCDAYQYDEKCHNKFFDDKYWHCCVNDKISFDMIIFEANSDVVAKLFDDFDKNAILQRDENFKYFDHFLWKMRFTDDFNSRKRLSKRCKKFQKMIITFNNVLSFIHDNTKMNEMHNVWITFRIMKSIHHMLNVFLSIQMIVVAFVRFFRSIFRKKSYWNVWLMMNNCLKKFFTNYKTWWSITIYTFSRSRIAIIV